MYVISYRCRYSSDPPGTFSLCGVQKSNNQHSVDMAKHWFEDHMGLKSLSGALLHKAIVHLYEEDGITGYLQHIETLEKEIPVIKARTINPPKDIKPVIMDELENDF